MGCTSSATKSTLEPTSSAGEKSLVLSSSVADSMALTSVEDNHGSLVPSHHTDEFGNLVDDKNGGRVWPEDYYQARMEADEHAVQRGKYFERSKKAFEDGQKKEAKELSDQGKKHGELMEEANKRAVKVILDPQHLDTADRIDLHGLLVSEAVDATKTFVFSCIGRLSTVEIITGAGHHSDPTKGPVIKPAIVKLCKEQNWQLDAHEKNEGSFTLHVPKSSSNQL